LRIPSEAAPPHCWAKAGEAAEAVPVAVARSTTEAADLRAIILSGVGVIGDDVPGREEVELGCGR